MRIHEILTESQLQRIEEGPLLNKIGAGIGKVAGTVAKGVGAVAGGVAGLGSAVKKGFQAGKAVVGGAGDDVPGAPPAAGAAAAPKTAAAPAAADPAGAAAPAGAVQQPALTGGPTAGLPPAPSGAAPSAQDINAQGPAGTAPAKAQTGAAGAALAKTDAVTDKQTSTKAGETVYAQVKANVDKLDKKGKQRILQLLTKSMAAPDPKAAPAGAAPAAGGAPKPGAPKPGAAPAAGAADPAAAPAAGAADPAAAPAADPAAAGAADPAAAPANTMANAPVSATNTAAADNPNQQPPATTGRTQGGGKQKGVQSQTPKAIAGRAATQARKDAAAKANAAGAGAFGQMANRLPQQNASKDNYGNALSEALARRVEVHKQKMFETGLARGTVSVFRK